MADAGLSQPWHYCTSGRNVRPSRQETTGVTSKSVRWDEFGGGTQGSSPGAARTGVLRVAALSLPSGPRRRLPPWRRPDGALRVAALSCRKGRAEGHRPGAARTGALQGYRTVAARRAVLLGGGSPLAAKHPLFLAIVLPPVGPECIYRSACLLQANSGDHTIRNPEPRPVRNRRKGTNR